MATLSLLFFIASIFLGVQVITLITNLVLFPVLQTPQLLPSGKASQETAVSILIPARNEAMNLPETLPAILEQAAEVIVLDDNSSDDTWNILETFAKTHAKLKIMRGKCLPEGWSGKNWACQQLAQAASGELLIFTDADVFWQAGTLASLLQFREAQKADFVSVWPRQLTQSLFERITVPAIDLILLGALPYWGVKHLPFAAFAAGNGQLMLWTRAAYQKVGGHAAFKAEVLEDVRMAQAAKRLGLKVALALGGQEIATRMYRSDKAMLEGFSKNIIAASGNKLFLLTLALLNTLAHSLAWVFVMFNPWWLVIISLSLLLRFLSCFKTQRPVWECILQPLMAFPMWLIVLQALRQNRSYHWKGRVYGQSSE